MLFGHTLVWIRNNEGKEKSKNAVICRVCTKTVLVKGGNTSNLLSHIKIHHLLQHTELTKSINANRPSKQTRECSKDSSKQNSLRTMPKSAQKYDRNGKKWKNLTAAVTNCLAKDMMPIYSVQKEGFRQLLATFDPQYELPSQKYFSNTAIPKLYGDSRGRCK